MDLRNELRNYLLKNKGEYNKESKLSDYIKFILFIISIIIISKMSYKFSFITHSLNSFELFLLFISFVYYLYICFVSNMFKTDKNKLELELLTIDYNKLYKFKNKDMLSLYNLSEYNNLSTILSDKDLRHNLVNEILSDNNNYVKTFQIILNNLDAEEMDFSIFPDDKSKINYLESFVNKGMVILSIKDVKDLDDLLESEFSKEKDKYNKMKDLGNVVEDYKKVESKLNEYDTALKNYK